MHVLNTVNPTVYVNNLLLHVCGIKQHGINIMIIMLGLFIVLTLVEQRLLFYQIQPRKRSYMAPTLVFYYFICDSQIFIYREVTLYIL